MELAEKSSYGKEGFVIETWASKGHAISRKELIWDNKVFLAANGVTDEHEISRKELICCNKVF